MTLNSGNLLNQTRPFFSQQPHKLTLELASEIEAAGKARVDHPIKRRKR